MEPQYIPVQTMLLRIQNAIAKKQISKVALSQASGVPRTTLIGIEDENWDPRVSTVSRLYPVVHNGLPVRAPREEREGTVRALPAKAKSAYRLSRR
jgi:DNA-binding XRE family transcriptional regulator